MNTNTDPVRALIGEMTEYLDQQVDPELDVIAKWRDRLEAARQPGTLDPRSTHRVFRNDEWLPCYCAATRDHWIGGEVMADGQQPAAPSDETLRLAGVIADKIEDGTLFQAGIFSRRDLADKIRAVVRFARQGVPPAALASAPVAREAVAWLRMKPDGTPDWAEDCIGSDDKFLDHEMASDGYYLQPLYAAPQQPAAVDEGMVEQRARELLEAECGRPLPLDVPVCAAHSAVVAALIAARAKEDRNG